MTIPKSGIISLLSQRCIDLLDLAVPNWQSAVLPKGDTAETAEIWQALKACELRTLGDLSAVTPLTLLALGAKIAGPPPEGTPFWAHVLHSSRASLRLLLAPLLAELLSDALKPGSTREEPTAQQLETGYSSLLIQPGEAFDQVAYPDSISIINWPFAGRRQVDFAVGEIRATPLLAAHVRAALRERGCDLSAIPVRELSLSTRPANACARAGVTTLDTLARQTPEQMAQWRNFGPTAYQEVIAALRIYLIPWLTHLPADILVPPERLHPFIVEQEALPLPRTALDPTKLIVQPKSTNDVLFPNQMPPYQGKNALFFPIDIMLQALGRLPAQQQESQPVLSLEDARYNALLNTRLTEALVEQGCNLEKTSVQQLFFRDGFPSSSLSIRTYNALVRSGIHTLGELIKQTPANLIGIRNFGVGCFQEVIEQLHTYLQPWLQELGINPATGEGAAAYEDPPAIPEEERAIQPAAAIRLADAFASLRSSDLFSWLEYYEIEWQRIKVAEAYQPLAGSALHVGPSDLTLGELDKPAQMAAPQALVTPEIAEQIITNIWQILIMRLVEHLLQARPSEQEQESHQQTLARATVESLLAETLNHYILTKRKNAEQKIHDLPREMTVMLSRAGILDGQAKTLEELAAAFHLTRERIRQLELRAEEAIQKGASRPFVQGLAALMKWAIHAEGGVTTLSRAAERIAGWLSFGDLHPEATIKLLVKWATGKSPKSDARLVASPSMPPLLDVIDKYLEQILTSHPSGLPYERLLDEVMLAGGSALLDAGRTFVGAAIRLSDVIELQEGFCLPREGRMLPRQLVSVLRKLGRPAHFNEIAERYNELFPEEKPRSGHTVQAILLRFPETFTRTGHGTYALTEAGYEGASTVADALEHILQESDRPLHASEVVAQGKKKYQWKETALQAGLRTNPKILSFGHGFFGLAARSYPGFDAAKSYEALFGVEPVIKERLVMATYTNQYHHPVVQVKLSEHALLGSMRLSNKPLRDLFPVEGHFKARGLAPGQPEYDLSIKRGQYDISGLARWFKRHNAQPGDVLLIEKLPGEQVIDDYSYRLAYAPADRLAEAMQMVGLSPDDEAGGALDYRVLWRCREPEKLSGLLTYTLEHSWAAKQAINTALGFAPGSPHSADYIELGLLGGLLAVGKIERDVSTEIIQPTPFGRAWIAQRHDAETLAMSLVLSLPPYRAHLRSQLQDKPAGENEDMEQMTTSLLDPRLLTTWDTRYGLIMPALGDKALRESNAVLTTARLPGPVLALLLLLLAAQSNGLGIALPSIEAGGLADAQSAAARLRQLGIALRWNASDHIALAEQVHLAVTAAASVEERLRTSGGSLGSILAECWRALQQSAWPLHSIHASNLYAELMGADNALFNSLLVSVPEGTDQAARYADGRCVPCPFVSLAADWGMTSAEHAREPFAFLSHATRLISGQVVDPIAICLNRELLEQPWDAKQALAANAHLALLTLIAGDVGGLAEQCSISEHGYLLAGKPLIRALDNHLRGLGYIVWDEGYCQNVATQIALGQALVALGERSGLLTTTTRGIETLSTLATAVYYSAYDVLLRLQTIAQRRTSDHRQPDDGEMW